MTLTEIRKRSGLTIRAVAGSMGMTHPNVIRIEREGNAPFSTLEKYAIAVGVPFETIVEAARCTYKESQRTPHQSQ